MGPNLPPSSLTTAQSSTSGYDSETPDQVWERHLSQLELFFQAASAKKIQFKLEKSKFGWSRIPMLGFTVGEGRRTVQPNKTQALRDWPQPKSLDDVVSFRAFANFLREFIPRFTELDQRLKLATKKGMKWSEWSADAENLAAFEQMKTALTESAALYMPDYEAAKDPTSGRPLELYVDACEYGWGCTLAQRERPDGAPRPIACFSKSFSPTEQAWSTFERELCGLKDSLIAVDPMTRGFPLVVLTDHKNNLFTQSLLGNRRMQKKLLRWSLELEDLCTRVTRVWIKGTDNVLGDAPSRNPKDRDAVKDLPVPAGPVKRVVRAMFEAPMELESECSELSRFLGQLESADPDAKLTAGDREQSQPSIATPAERKDPLQQLMSRRT